MPAAPRLPPRRWPCVCEIASVAAAAAAGQGRIAGTFPRGGILFYTDCFRGGGGSAVSFDGGWL